MKFAVYYGNRGFFPGEVIATARREMEEALTRNGYEFISLPEGLTRYGAVETIAEGQRYAAFLAEHRGEYDGIVLCRSWYRRTRTSPAKWIFPPGGMRCAGKSPCAMSCGRQESPIP